jgi:hypothetical protein
VGEVGCYEPSLPEEGNRQDLAVVVGHAGSEADNEM